MKLEVWVVQHESSFFWTILLEQNNYKFYILNLLKINLGNVYEYTSIQIVSNLTYLHLCMSHMFFRLLKCFLHQEKNFTERFFSGTKMAPLRKPIFGTFIFLGVYMILMRTQSSQPPRSLSLSLSAVMEMHMRFLSFCNDNSKVLQ